MRREHQLLGRQAKLLQNFSGVAMVEYGVGGEVFRHFNKMGLLRGLLARAGDAGFRIADRAKRKIQQPGARQRGQR